MKKGRFLWSAHRITERQKAGKARSIKEKQLKNSRNTVSRQLVALRSSASDNRLLRLYQNGSKTPENQGFPGFSCTQTYLYSLTSFDLTRAVFTGVLVVRKWLTYRTAWKGIWDLGLMKERLSNRKIAERLFLSEGSIKQYINQIYSKLNIDGIPGRSGSRFYPCWMPTPNLWLMVIFFNPLYNICTVDFLLT